MMISTKWCRSILKSFLVAILSVCVLSSSVSARERLVIIGTATQSGLFYPIGVEICKIINKNYLNSGVRCIAAVTDGALYNLMALRTGELDVAFTTSYAAWNSITGQEMFVRYGADLNLRQVANLYSTPVTIVVAGGKISSLEALKGKKISLGLNGGAKRSIAEELFRKVGWSEAEVQYAQKLEYPDDKALDEFCNGRLDGFLMITGMPSPIYDKALTKCNGEIMDIPQDLIKQIVAENPSLTSTTIPPGAYNRSSHGIHTFALDSVLVASSETPAEIVSLVHGALRDNLKRLSTTFKVLKESKLDAAEFSASKIPAHEALRK